jgi:hypothetical protein
MKSSVWMTPDFDLSFTINHHYSVHSTSTVLDHLNTGAPQWLLAGFESPPNKQFNFQIKLSEREWTGVRYTQTPVSF